MKKKTQEQQQNLISEEI